MTLERGNGEGFESRKRLLSAGEREDVPLDYELCDRRVVVVRTAHR